MSVMYSATDHNGKHPAESVRHLGTTREQRRIENPIHPIIVFNAGMITGA